MKILLTRTVAFIFLFFAGQQLTKAQVTFTSWTHPPYITLYASAVGAGVATSTDIVVDDAYSSVIPLGFNFSFYDSSHSSLVIGANGNICFDTTLAGNYDPWPITAVLAGNSEVYNCICGPFCDMDIVFGGNVTYFVTGTAPNRIFGANFCHDAMYSSSSCPGQWTTTQMLLYETSNNIDVHLQSKTICTAWNGGKAIIGVQNATGTTSTVAPGRDGDTTWTATDESWRFTPDSAGLSYSVSSIPYSPISYYTIYWYDSVTNAYLGSGDSIVLTPSVVTTYSAYAVGCVDSSSVGFDTVATGHMTLMPLSAGEVVSLTKDFNIYPNPVQNQLYLVSGTIINEVIITDILGQVVYRSNANALKVNVDNHELPTGVYFARINNAVSKKFVKE